ncbi:hypothetical protein MVEG_11374 [Podila verticillata NRRL 6337]|uniref:Uncharacterized protein n=1 Tax=Podila verticillata NRRL 6337 TaxID=1069443 RepID=A0A086TLM2_9FUNG|nr:hypothetical protein MVEG_11374 [Podila verticillata NRRL 6337]
MDDKGLPQIISLGPGTQSAHRPLESMWTTEGFLSIKDGTDEELYVHPSNTIFNINHPVAFSAKDLSEKRPNIPGYHTLTLQDITAKYLKGLQTSAETIITRNITFISIVLPVGIVHGDSRQVALSDACKAAGLPWSELFKKSFVAFFEFELYNVMDERLFLFYRVGSSTLEVSVVSSDNFFGTLSFVRDQYLGGNNFNKRVVNHLLRAHEKRTGQDLSSDDKFMIHLGGEVEKAKQALSFQSSVRVEIESSIAGGQDFSEQLTRSQFEDLNMDLFTKTMAAVDQALKDAGLTKNDIRDVVLSGGSSNIPFLQSTLKHYFGEKKNYQGSNQPETVALFGAAKFGQQIVVRDKYYSSGICCGWIGPLSIGIETTGGVMFKYADWGSSQVFDKTFTFSTAMDNQNRVVIKIFEGERARASQNVFLGGIELSGIPPAPKGVPQIRVRLKSPSCGNKLYLSVMELATKRINVTAISPRSAYLEDDEIYSKISEAQEFEHEDRLMWENAEAAGTMTLLNPA